jgi:hypothetical protein
MPADGEHQQQTERETSPVTGRVSITKTRSGRRRFTQTVNLSRVDDRSLRQSDHTGQPAPVIIAAPSVAPVASSIMISPPVIRLRA